MMHIRRLLNTIRSFPLARYLPSTLATPANLSDMIENKYTFNKATIRSGQIIKPSLKGAPRVVRPYLLPCRRLLKLSADSVYRVRRPPRVAKRRAWRNYDLRSRDFSIRFRKVGHFENFHFEAGPAVNQFRYSSSRRAWALPRTQETLKFRQNANHLRILQN